jgi:gliding motility-associated-like protein
VSVPGTYYATVKIGGCSATDSVVVDNNCFVNLPNCFTPNGDGVNDYFNPRDYFQKGLKSFVLTVYNRWGQVIFETDATDGRGWDGKFNNTTQPAGVYIYNIDAQFVDGQKLNKHGNLTIIR